MLKFDTGNGKLISLQQTNLVNESILERYDLQAAIVASWNEFCIELGIGELYFIDSEVIPHDSCRDSIDILAIDWEGTPIVIELKREKNKLQLLQALSYVAMISGWTPEDYIRQAAKSPNLNDVKSILEGIETMADPQIVLIAEDYDPEVILTSDFLGNHDVSVTAVAVALTKHEGELLMSFDRRYPLRGLDDSYTPRVRSKSSSNDRTESTWEDVISWTSVPWTRESISQFRTWGFGGENPSRRGFGTKRNTPFGNIISAGFRTDHMVVHVIGQSQEDSDRITKLINIPVEPWGRTGDRRSGWAFRVKTQDEWQKFVHIMNN